MRTINPARDRSGCNKQVRVRTASPSIPTSAAPGDMYSPTSTLTRSIRTGPEWSSQRGLKRRDELLLTQLRRLHKWCLSGIICSFLIHRAFTTGGLQSRPTPSPRDLSFLSFERIGRGKQCTWGTIDPPSLSGQRTWITEREESDCEGCTPQMEEALHYVLSVTIHHSSGVAGPGGSR